ncbi:TPA: hypothetical protein QFF42_000112 [Enterococcus faecium]
MDLINSVISNIFNSWPLLILILAFIFRKEIKFLLSKVSKIKYKDMEIEFVEKLDILNIFINDYLEMKLDNQYSNQDLNRVKQSIFLKISEISDSKPTPQEILKKAYEELLKGDDSSEQYMKNFICTSLDNLYFESIRKENLQVSSEFAYYYLRTVLRYKQLN